MDFDSLTKIGAMIGSGGLVVMDEDTCMVEVARFFMNFTQRESCGKCVPCREGTKRMLEILERIVAERKAVGPGRTAGAGRHDRKYRLCGLGKSAPKPVISTMHAFRRRVSGTHRREEMPSGNLLQPAEDYGLIRRNAKAARSAQELSGKRN